MLRLAIALIASSCVTTQTATDRLEAHSLTIPVEIRQLHKDSLQVQTDLLRRQTHDALEVEQANGLDASGLLEQWDGMASERKNWHYEILGLIEPWEEELNRTVNSLSAGPEARVAIDRIARSCVATLRTWIEVDEPEFILERLESEAHGIAALLPRLTDKDVRRQVLNVLIERQSGCPGYSDLDLLTHLVEWEALFLKDLPPGKDQLDSLSEDLILLFTERASDGISRSSAGYFQAGRFTDRGFKREFRDGNDQLRHFAWAFRIFATSSNPDQGEALLVLKETRDAFARDEPLNQADLSLNRAVRDLVAELLGRDEDGLEIGLPVAIEEYATRIHRQLGNSRSTRD